MRSISATVVRRLSACLAAVGVLAAASIAAAPMAAARSGPAGGYPGPAGGGFGYDPHDPAGSVAPSQWLSLSSHTFQRLMRMLAERSAQLGAPEMPPLGPPEPPRPPEAPERHEEPSPPEPERVAPAGPGALPWERRRGGEAAAGPNRPIAVPARDWPGRSPEPPPPSWQCRGAGLPVGRDGWYVVADGDTLWSIAEVHYGYGEGYVRILRANRERLDESGVIHPCQRLHIPVW